MRSAARLADVSLITKHWSQACHAVCISCLSHAPISHESVMSNTLCCQNAHANGNLLIRLWLFMIKCRANAGFMQKRGRPRDQDYLLGTFWNVTRSAEGN